MSDLKELIRQLAKDDQEELYSVVGDVIEVQEADRTVTVRPVNGGVDVFGVRLQALQGGVSGLTVFPAVGSQVIVTFLNKYTGYVAAFTEVDGYIIETPQESLKDILNDLITAIGNITVTTPQGPSTPPLLNKAEFDAIALRLDNLLRG